MVAAIRLRTTGRQRVEREMGRLARRFGDLTELMEAFGLALESSTIDRFDRETDPDGNRWTPSIRARETGGKTGTDTARFKQSITHRAGARQVEVGSNIAYAGPFHSGATIRARSGGRLKFRLPGGLGFRSPREVTIPARPVVGVSRDDEAELLDLAGVFARDAAPGLAQ